MTDLLKDDLVRTWILDLREAVQERDETVWVPINGAPGCGKSTLMLQLAGAVDPTFYDEPLWHRIAWTGSTLVRLRGQVSPGSALAADEMRDFWKREGMTTGNREVAHSAFEERKLNHLILALGPDWNEVDPSIRETTVAPDWRIEIPRKGEWHILQAHNMGAGRPGGYSIHTKSTFHDLSGTKLWEVYSRLADRFARTGEQPEGQLDELDEAEQEEEPSTVEQLVRSREDRVRGVADRWRRATAPA